MLAVVDNDVLSKGACYHLLPDLVTGEVGSTEPVGVLGEARFVVPKKIRKSQLLHGPEAALAQLAEFIEHAETLEPSESEQQLAAELELSAQKRGLNLHGGESQLCAIALARQVPLLLTGDKQAITALEQLADVEEAVLGLRGRLKCIEQLVFGLLRRSDPAAVRASICGEPAVDRSLSVCFSCTSSDPKAESMIAGLESYVGNIRRQAERLLST